MNRGLLKKEVLEDMYIYQKLPMYIISRLSNVSVGSVFNYLKNYEIPIRSMSDATKGKKKSKETIEKIRLKNTGLKRTKEFCDHQSLVRKLHTMGHKKIRGDGYILLYYPDHPDSSKDGYIMEHRFVMEKSINSRINKCDIVHHKNKNRKDNRIENLELMTAKEHAYFHMTERNQNRRASL